MDECLAGAPAGDQFRPRDFRAARLFSRAAVPGTECARERRAWRLMGRRDARARPAARDSIRARRARHTLRAPLCVRVPSPAAPRAAGWGAPRTSAYPPTHPDSTDAAPPPPRSGRRRSTCWAPGKRPRGGRLFGGCARRWAGQKRFRLSRRPRVRGRERGLRERSHQRWLCPPRPR